MFSFVHKTVLFGIFPPANSRALDRAFWCSPSCQKSCLLMLSSLCQKSCSILYFLVFSFVPRACFLVLSFVQCSPLSRNRGLDGAFWCSPVLKIVVWMALAVTPIRLDSRDNVGVVDVRCR